MKNSGITWKIHVTHCIQGATCNMSFRVSVPFSIAGAAISQWPMTTTAIDAARRKST